MFLLISFLLSHIVSTEGCDNSDSWSLLKPENTNCFEIDDGQLTLLFSDHYPNAVYCPFPSGVKARIDHGQPEYVKELACRCSKEARDQSYSWFAIGRKGECFVCYTAIKSLHYLLPDENAQNMKDDGRLKHRKNCYVYEKLGETPIEDRVIKANDILVGGEGAIAIYELYMESDVHDDYMYTGGLSCANPIDVGFVVDVSGSVGIENFHKLVEWLKNFIRLIYTDEIRICFSIYDHRVYPELYFEDTQEVGIQEILKKVSQISYSGGATLTQKALDKVLHTCFEKNHQHLVDGNKVSQFLMVYTDGRTWGGSNTLVAPSEELKKLGVVLLAVGIGDANEQELLTITQNRNRTFMFDSFQTFLNGFRERMTKIAYEFCDVADAFDEDYDY